MRTALATATTAALLAASGCAWTAGGAFSEIENMSSLKLQLPMSKGRLDSGGRWLTNNGYALTLDGGFVAPAAKVALVGSSGGGGATAFDPATPPAGYTLCHSGHCHRNDGALIVYADVEADLIRKAGGTATASVADVTWSLSGSPLMPGAELVKTAPACSPSCFLSKGTIAGADLAVTSLTASGTVEATPGASPLAGGTRAWTLTLKQPEAFKGNAVQAINRDAPPGLALEGTLALTDKLFDDLDWAAFGSTSPITLDTSPVALAKIRANFARSKWTVSFTAQN